jgi:transcription factor SPN1
MSDVEDDLFADSDSDDTADLIATSKTTTSSNQKKATTTPNNRLQKKKSPAAKKAAKATKEKPAAAKKASKAAKAKAADSDSDDEKDDDKDDDDDDKGLFDSDSDDDEIAGKRKKSAAAAAKKAPEPPTKTLSKREKMEALASRHRKVDPAAAEDGDQDKAKRKSGDKGDKNSKSKPDGYGSEDSYDSETFERTKEDDDFLDTTGEDAEAVNELYADQHFNDERPDREDGGQKIKKRKIRYGRDDNMGAGDDDDDGAGGDGGEGGAPMNPVMAAVHRMKKIKRVKLSFTEMEEEAKMFIGRMELAVDEDEMAIAERRPAVKKLGMLNEVLQMLARRDIQRVLLDLDLLVICKRWVQPLKNGTLGNVTVRQRLMEAIANMTGDTGVNAMDLKGSEFGKVVMTLAMHKSETPTMKRQLKALIDQWSRPIFQKSGNMRDLERVHGSRGEGGLAALSRQQHAVAKQTEAAKRKVSSSERQDLQSLITSGKKGGPEAGINRVRVPYSKGFNFSIRPENKTSHADTSPADKRRAGPAKDNRGKLSKRMVEKGRAVVKSQASANVSVVGRPTK